MSMVDLSAWKPHWDCGYALSVRTWTVVIPPATKLGGYTGFSVSVCLSVRLSVVRVFCFPDIFWIRYADNEMKLGMIVYNDELQIKFEFRCY
jgi:hypothetical protein